MDSSRKPQKANPKREAKHSKNHSSTPPQKDAYARLLSQHCSSKFSTYLEQYAKESSLQTDGIGPSTLLKAHSARLNIPQHNRDQVPNDFSDSSDFSPSSMKSKGEESSLSMYMEKLSTRNAPQDYERKLGVSDRQRQGQRRDTTTSQDGDIESGEEFGSLGPNNDSKKHQRQQKKNKDTNRDATSKEIDSFDGQAEKKASTIRQEQEKIKKSKKKNQPRHTEEEKGKDAVVNDDKDKPQQPRGKFLDRLNIVDSQ